MVDSSNYEPVDLKVTNFGPIKKAEIQLRPLTVFIGPSGTGKSYLAGLIYALHRCFNRFSNDPLLLYHLLLKPGEKSEQQGTAKYFR